MRLFCFGFLLCTGCLEAGSAREVEPISLPTDPAKWGVEVGVQTIDFEGQRLEVWYPATSDSADGGGETVDFTEFIPTVFTDHLGQDVDLPAVPTDAVRDAAIRLPEEPLPVLLFSHGFGGMRVQSMSITSHLASRGFVVVAPDHPGRMLTDVLPCLISPPLDGCDLSGFGADPALDDLDVALAWVDAAAQEPEWEDIIDPERVGLLGHSAGANSTTAKGESDERYAALVPMAGGGAVSRDVPVLRVDASCDGFVPSADETVLDTMTDGRFVQLHGGGHLAFTDLCDLNLGALADEIVAPRSDANSALLPQMRKLAVDGCPGEPPLVELPECAEEFLPLEISDEILRYHLTNFFDVVFKGRADVSQERPFTDATIRTD